MAACREGPYRLYRLLRLYSRILSWFFARHSRMYSLLDAIPSA